MHTYIDGMGTCRLHGLHALLWWAQRAKWSVDDEGTIYPRAHRCGGGAPAESQGTTQCVRVLSIAASYRIRQHIRTEHSSDPIFALQCSGRLVYLALLTHPTTPTEYPTNPPTRSLSLLASSCHFLSMPTNCSSRTTTSPCSRKKTLIHACTSS